MSVNQKIFSEDREGRFTWN